MTVTWEEAGCWRRGLELLSLDLSHLVFLQLGVGIEPEEALREIVRGALVDERPKRGEGRNIEPLRSYLTFYSERVIPFLDKLEEHLGPDAVAKVRYWIRYRFCTGGQNPWLAYEDALSSWAANLRIKGVDEIGLLADPRRIEQKFRHITRNMDLRPKLMAGAHESTSIWDLSLFKDRGFDEIPRDSKFFPFIDDFLVAINMTAFQSFWAWLIAEVTEVDLYSIERFVKEKASRQGADFCSAAALPRL